MLDHVSLVAWLSADDLAADWQLALLLLGYPAVAHSPRGGVSGWLAPSCSVGIYPWCIPPGKRALPRRGSIWLVLATAVVWLLRCVVGLGEAVGRGVCSFSTTAERRRRL